MGRHVTTTPPCPPYHAQIVALPLDQLQPNATWTAWYEPGDRGDTLQFPQAKRGPGAGITLRIQPGPFSGYSMMHCHVSKADKEGSKTVPLSLG